MKLTENIQWPLLMTWLNSGGQKVKITAGRRVGEGFHIDAGGFVVHLLV